MPSTQESHTHLGPHTQILTPEEEGGEWFGIPASGSVNPLFSIWSVRKVLEPDDAVFTWNMSGLKAQLEIHLAGKTSATRLTTMSQSRDKGKYLLAASDPKLPEAQRSRLVKRCLNAPTQTPGEVLCEALLSNPCLPTEDIEKLANLYKLGHHCLVVKSASLSHLVYEHPNCSQYRRAELLTLEHTRSHCSAAPDRYLSGTESEYENWRTLQPDRVIKLLPDLLEAASVRSASMHLDLTAEQIQDLVQRWSNAAVRWSNEYTLMTGPQEIEAGDRLYPSTIARWGRNIGEGAARLCTHPKTPSAAVTHVLKTIRGLSGEAWHDMAREWPKFGKRPLAVDLEILKQMDTGPDKAKDYIVWSAVMAMKDSPPQDVDSEFLIRTIELLEQNALTSNMNEESLSRIKGVPDLLDRIQWTKELVRRYLTSEEPRVREIGIYGVSRLAQTGRVQKSTTLTR